MHFPERYEPFLISWKKIPVETKQVGVTKFSRIDVKVFMHKCIEESLSIISEPNWETRVNLCEKESLAVGFLASKITQCNSYKGSVANFG